jgi:hypothetical protein
LHWGGVEVWDLQFKQEYFNNPRIAIPKMLDMFNQYKFHCTWATVGFLFAKNRDQLREFRPKAHPSYLDTGLNYYSLIEQNRIGYDEDDDPFLYVFRQNVHYVSSNILAINLRFISVSPKKMLTVLAIPFGILLYVHVILEAKKVY